MINLAGSKDSDRVISEELEIASIPFHTGIVKQYGEVKAKTIGLLGSGLTQDDVDQCKRLFPETFDPAHYERYSSFVFTRAWYYYIVSGLVPEEVAWKIYNSRHSKDIRVAGHCGCVEPVKPWLTSHRVAGQYCIDQYHIDSQIGLNTFVKIVTQEGLV